jgi:hypothetical protein
MSFEFEVLALKDSGAGGIVNGLPVCILVGSFFAR